MNFDSSLQHSEFWRTRTAVETAPRVLIIDDDDKFRDNLRSSLEFGGVNAVYCENATEALLSAMLEKFHFIVTDYRMPGMNGVELTRRLRTRHPHSIIIGMSGQDVSMAFLLAGATDFLLKPFDADMLPLLFQGEVPSV